MNPATARLALVAIQALVQLGITAQRIGAIADEAEKNGGEVSDDTVAAVEADVKAAHDRWDRR